LIVFFGPLINLVQELGDLIAILALALARLHLHGDTTSIIIFNCL